MPTKLIAITGGIGSGKTVVSRILTSIGFPVYDCDSKAKAIMDCDETIHRRIENEIDASCINQGCIDRSRLASIVFSDPDRLAILNDIVHGAVRRDITLWAARQTSAISFVETAILYESGLDSIVQAVWNISAPEELRITRVMSRSGLSARQIRNRIKSQTPTIPTNSQLPTTTIVNDNLTPLLPQIESALIIENV